MRKMLESEDERPDCCLILDIYLHAHNFFITISSLLGNFVAAEQDILYGMGET